MSEPSEIDVETADMTNGGETASDAVETTELTNKSVIKAATILNELGRFPAGITVTELAQHVRMSRPTAFRLLLSLEQTGFVERLDNKYKLGWKIARLGRLADPHQGIIARVQPILKALADGLNEMVGYAVVNGEADFDLIAEAHSNRLITLSQGYVGRDFPIHASATGKQVLADLNDERIEAIMPRTLERFASKTITDRKKLIRDLHEVRERGYAIVDDELEESLFAMSVPVHDELGHFIGVLSVTGPSERMRSRPLDDLAAQLRQTASEIARALAPGK
ncbi:IclR family transcriptional regulator [Novosphingobium sp. YAF33]|uniref:IclR family transcriptional regulator n=1 Tax=Novosphingobium sp. YAF33 TaxID=3233082 RepID=UPI003F999307